MIVDENEVQDEIVEQFRVLLKDDVSDYKGSPAVMASFEGGLRPMFPFVTVDIESNQDLSGGSAVFRDYVDGKLVIVAEERLIYKITCQAEIGASRILNKLRFLFKTGTILSAFDSATGVTFQYFSRIDTNPVYLNTEFIKAASMTITVTASSSTAEDTDLIEQIITEESYFHDLSDDEPALVITQTIGEVT